MTSHGCAQTDRHDQPRVSTSFALSQSTRDAAPESQLRLRAYSWRARWPPGRLGHMVGQRQISTNNHYYHAMIPNSSLRWCLGSYDYKGCRRHCSTMSSIDPYLARLFSSEHCRPFSASILRFQKKTPRAQSYAERLFFAPDNRRHRRPPPPSAVIVAVTGR